MLRYFYYNMVLVMLMNIMIFVPSILIKDRYDGAMMSMLVAIMIGVLMTLAYMYAFKAFPGQGLPEILSGHVSRWIYTPILALFGLIPFIYGLQVLVGYSVLINRFITPDIELSHLLLFTSLIVWFGASRSSKTVLIISEIILVINLPLVLLILFKALTGDEMNWDAVRTIFHHTRFSPTFRGVSAATFIFAGTIIMTIMNRLFQVNDIIRFKWLIPVVGTLTLLTSFFIPIGYHGTEGVATFVYPWITTSDSMSMEFGFIERVLFIFSIMYLNLSLLFSIVMWHISAELLKGCFPAKKPNFDTIETPVFTNIVCGIFVIASYFYAFLFKELQFFMIGEGVHKLRFITDIGLILLLLFLTRRRKQA
ncbi:GerAB/ArcD/ProY family transporter [Paenibacillus eucommiae]|uniref:Spore germination protein n=1 Tax=Paenibacillus eucommiae TaxID=1355755 RepID=A0ABS4J288_9BACL|nr:GerAB/ArcD/ProY family transporter [Paenibacillus eucommiae]MBP1993933.1 hypothetical protein [Paenibacillus eucommiae]